MKARQDLSAFLNDLAKFGYTRGQNLAIEYRYAAPGYARPNIVTLPSCGSI